MEKIFKIFICVLIICGLTHFAFAGMWWTRGDAGSTYQMWTFDDADNPAFPEIDQNPYGQALAIITVNAGSSSAAGWDSSGIWYGHSAEVLLTIPNNPLANDYKEIWVEVGCRGHFPPDVENPPNSGLGLGTGYFVLNPTGNDVSVIDLGFTFVEDKINAGRRILTFGVRISPNPNYETIYFMLLNSGADVDYISLDTICLPEPATLAILGLGAIVSIIGRKKG